MSMCTGKTVMGQQCRRTPREGRETCFVHDPETAARHRQGSKHGGMRARGTVGQLDVSDLNLATLDGLKGLLARALGKAAELSFSEKTANAIGTLSGQLRQLLQDADLERRLALLEKASDDTIGHEPWRHE
jgi:hypothetical protein